MFNKMFFFLLISFASSSIEYLSKGISLKFTFLDNEELFFEFSVPTRLLSTHDWVGFSLFPASLPLNQRKGDCYIFPLSSDSFQDYFISPDQSLNLDTDLKGSLNIIESTKRTVKNYTVFSLTRKLDTLDRLDTKLLKGHAYAVKWELGIISDKKFTKSSDSDQGVEFFVLSDEYEDRNTDETNTFGPFRSSTQNNISPPFDWTPENYEWSILVENYFVGKTFEPEELYATDPEGNPSNFDLPDILE